MIFAALMAAIPLAVPQPPLSLDEVMERVERYVDSYGDKASIVVGTERYEQHASSSASPDPTTRTLVSDFGIVRADAIRGWLGFRDVMEVDSRPLPDREGRLARVLIASEGRYDEALRLSNESARFNIGAIQRNFNVPTTALFFFNREYRGHFKFATRRVDANGVWEITFKETGTPTLINTPEGASVRSSGTLWVRPDSGTIVRTLLQLELVNARGTAPQRGTGRVDVTFQRVEALDMWLPLTMDEKFEASKPLPLASGLSGPAPSPTWDRVSGHATYDNYRKFTTAGRIK
jgi:hypothetical protein